MILKGLKRTTFEKITGLIDVIILTYQLSESSSSSNENHCIVVLKKVV